jgi:hypothetical protein
MSADLAHRVQMAFDRCKAFPEIGAREGIFHVRGDAYLALIELRSLCPEIALALLSAAASSGPSLANKDNQDVGCCAINRAGSVRVNAP